MKIKQGDNVIILTGKDAGKTGKVTQVLPKEGKVVVEGVNKIVKHIKAQGNNKGQRFEFFAPIDMSNVMLMDPKTNTPTRVGYKVLDNGQKVRINKKTGEEI